MFEEFCEKSRASGMREEQESLDPRGFAPRSQFARKVV